MRKHIENGSSMLEQRRKAIDLLDTEIVRLLNHRARIASELVPLKQSSGLPVQDMRREQQILERICEQNQGPLEPQALINIFRCILRESRKIQLNCMRQSETNFVKQENINGDQYGGKRIRG